MASETFERFREAYKVASCKSGLKRKEDLKKEVGKLLAQVLQETNKTAADLVRAKICSFMTVENWLQGSALPQMAQMNLLESFFDPQPVSDSRVLALTLSDDRFRNVLELVVEERKVGQEIDPVLLEKLVRWGMDMYCNDYTPRKQIPMDWLRFMLDAERRCS